jgi:A/G-specific adenine glycosylase
VVFCECVITYNHPAATPPRAPAPGAQRKRRSAPRPFAKKTQAKIAFVSQRAAAYFKHVDRDFPWRREPDPRRLALAEILWQETRAQSVVSTYLDIVESFPDARVLPSFGRDEAEKRLRPLGLSPKRTREFVELTEALRDAPATNLRHWRFATNAHPRIGSYAARAVACFGFGEAVGLVDANVTRVLRRVFGIRTADIRVADPHAEVFQRYADAVATVSPDARATNLGLLDLGATVCTPRPKCDGCPLASECHYATVGIV